MPSAIAVKACLIIAEARAAWDKDCRQVEVDLANLGLGFGVNGYRLAMERFLHRLDDGVADALAFVRKSAAHGEPEWAEAHAAVQEAIGASFVRQSQLIPALVHDPLVIKMLDRAHERISVHAAAHRRKWTTFPLRFVQRLFRSIG